jgi:hypothetical protein
MPGPYGHIWIAPFQGRSGVGQVGGAAAGGVTTGPAWMMAVSLAASVVAFFFFLPLPPLPRPELGAVAALE